MRAARRSVELCSKLLSVTVDPVIGGTITSIVHRELGLSVLGEVPWKAETMPIAGVGARDEAEWLTRYTGGWPLLFPNGGDACTVDGVFHGFHGEASVVPWNVAAIAPDRIELTRRFITIPAEMRRVLEVVDDLLVIREHVRVTGDCRAGMMWGHHPSFGSDLLAEPVEITTSGRMASVETSYDPPANPLMPGAKGEWPVVDGKAGRFDLSRPAAPLAAMAYLYDFDEAWIAMRRLDNTVGVALSWEAATFPCVWLWYELNGTTDAPWNGRGNVIGIEPNTTMPGLGLAEARRRGANLLRLGQGEEASTELRLHVFKPAGRITDVSAHGEAMFG